jgi:hypothetical protein
VDDDLSSSIDEGDRQQIKLGNVAEAMFSMKFFLFNCSMIPCL